MTVRLYYDTSALVKLFVRETGSDLIDKIEDSTNESRLKNEPITGLRIVDLGADQDRDSLLTSLRL